MKKTLLSWLLILFCMHGFSQFPLHTIFPMGVEGVAFGDSLLNRSAILKRAGIRKIIAEQTPLGTKGRFTTITDYLNANGTVRTKVTCLRRTENKDTLYCLSDTVLYDQRGRLSKYIAKDGKGFIYMVCKIDYLSEKKLKYSWITSTPQKAVSDTDIFYLHYNEKDQLVREEAEATQFKYLNASLFYNEDGLPDSIQHDNHAYPTYIFKRKQKRKTKEIELETMTTWHKWVYNASGQCISSEWTFTKQLHARNQSGKKPPIEAVYNYYYHPDGTLSKVIEKKKGKEVTATVYEYEK
jgi:hypothetical protein